MKKLLFVLMLLALLIPVFAKNSDYKPMVMVCNLGTEGMDIMIGDDDTTVFYTSSLDEFDTTALVPVDYDGEWNVYCRFPDEDDWTKMVYEDSEEDYTVELTDGEVLGLVISPDNIVHDFQLTYKDTGYAKVMFANLSYEHMAMMEVSDKFGNKDNVWCGSLDSFSLSNFGDGDAGTANLYWQPDSMVEDDDYYFYPDDNGDPEPQKIVRGKWYEMMVYEKDGKSYCNFFNITPKDSYKK